MAKRAAKEETAELAGLRGQLREMIEVSRRGRVNSLTPGSPGAGAGSCRRQR
jgi:hypothetical protein